MIGVAISTHNRRDIADHSIAEWRKFLPEYTRLVIVDDASDTPYPSSDYRFGERAGIAVVKNKCLELLEGCDHVFLVDDDIYPLDEHWWVPYVESELQHACYIFDREKLWAEPTYNSFALPRGCMLYFKMPCINVAGGFDTDFKDYGYEHAELSKRIYNMGLTPAPYIDVPDSKGLFYAHDEQNTCKSALHVSLRSKSIVANKHNFAKKQNANTFIPYK